jgi:hypothetical protein
LRPLVGGDGKEPEWHYPDPHDSARKECLASLSDEQCLLARPWVNGFDLTTKEWSFFQVDCITDVEFNVAAYDKLILPNGEKELAWSFVEAKGSARVAFDDFIPEKGMLNRLHVGDGAPELISLLFRSRSHYSSLWSAWRWQDLYSRSEYVYAFILELNDLMCG